MAAPRYFADVDKTFNAGSDFEESTVISDIDDFTFNGRVFLNTSCQNVPRVRLELFQAERNTFFLVVEAEDNDIEFLTVFEYIAWVFDTTPRNICNVQ